MQEVAMQPKRIPMLQVNWEIYEAQFNMTAERVCIMQSVASPKDMKMMYELQPRGDSNDEQIIFILCQSYMQYKGQNTCINKMRFN